MVPTVNPALLSAVVAASWVNPTTLGIATASGPVDTSMVTVDSGVDLGARAGFWAITWPLSTVGLGSFDAGHGAGLVSAVARRVSGHARRASGTGTCVRPASAG